MKDALTKGLAKVRSIRKQASEYRVMDRGFPTTGTNNLLDQLDDALHELERASRERPPKQKEAV